MSWKPESGSTPNRSFVLVDEGVFSFYHKHWQDIDRRWRIFVADEESWDAVKMMREVERNQLRAEIVKASQHGFTGTYLIPV